jgi:Ca-activated chloride channel family protein
MRSSVSALVCVSLLAASGCDSISSKDEAAYDMKAAGSSTPASAVKADVRADASGEGYDRIVENEFVAVADAPLSTFSVDVDTAAYSNVRRFLRQGQLPPKDAVRIEEMINYFDYAYPQPTDGKPFSVHTEVSAAPWAQDHRLVHIGLQGKDIQTAEIPSRNLVFLLDVSGSMNSPDKLPLLKQAMRLLTSQLDEDDRVSIVVYAGASGVVLEPTPGSEQETIFAAFDELSAGGSTNGGEGIQLAYALARKSFIDGGINRVVLATDGDFNVGVTGRGALERLIEKERETGVSLSVLGFGTGNVQDSQMEALADKGNGNYGYIDSLAEARKLLVEQAGGTLVTIAKDVKLQVEFNPAQVASYRLIGYENRMLEAQDFNDDTKDAGEIGAGHTVTAIYEVVPAGAAVVGDAPAVDALKYQGEREPTTVASGGELATVKLRYKAPRGDTSEKIELPITDTDTPLAKTTDAYRFSAAVAGFGMLLRNSRHAGKASYSQLRELAQGSLGQDSRGYRREFVKMLDTAAGLADGGQQRG